MAKLGMPTVVVKFIEAGIEAIQRSQRGIVALILEDTKQVIDKLATKTNGHEVLPNPFLVYTVDDIQKNYLIKIRITS